MLFTPRLFVLNGPTERETLRKPALIGQSVCVIARADCSFRRLRLAGRSADAKKAAILRARNESLADEDGIKVVIDNENLSADKPASSGIMAGVWGFGTSPSHSGRYLPEAIAQIPHDDGVRLVQGLSGFDGQIWQAGNLIASRWWARQPAENDWAVFIRAASETMPQTELRRLDLARPAAISVPWRTDLPVFDIDRERTAELLSPSRLGAIAAVIAACFAFYTAGQYMRASLALSSVNSTAEALRGETEQIQSERRRALVNMNYLRRYRALGDNGTVLASFGALANVLGSTDLGIERISLRDSGLEVRLGGEDEVSVPDVVSLLEAEPNMSNVSVALDARNTLVIKADISAPQSVANTTITPSRPAGGQPR